MTQAYYSCIRKCMPLVLRMDASLIFHAFSYSMHTQLYISLPVLIIGIFSGLDTIPLRVSYFIKPFLLSTFTFCSSTASPPEIQFASKSLTSTYLPPCWTININMLPNSALHRPVFEVLFCSSLCIFVFRVALNFIIYRY
jgi:hypothetical protein